MTNPTLLTYDDALFRATCPEFSSTSEYPTPLLQSFWDVATSFMSPTGNCGSLQGTQRQLGLNYFVGHLAQINNLIALGQVPALMQAATIDKVNITLTPPPVPNQFRWWLNLTPRGAALITLLDMNSVGGYYIGGSGVLAGFGYQGGNCWWV